MKPTRVVLAAAVLSVAACGAAFAQGAPPAAPYQDPPATLAQAGPDTAVNPPGAIVVPVSSANLGDTSQLKAGDPSVVSNPPVADTPENRVKYGQPMSNAGKRSGARGN